MRSNRAVALLLILAQAPVVQAETTNGSGALPTDSEQQTRTTPVGDAVARQGATGQSAEEHALREKMSCDDVGGAMTFAAEDRQEEDFELAAVPVDISFMFGVRNQYARRYAEERCANLSSSQTSSLGRSDFQRLRDDFTNNLGIYGATVFQGFTKSGLETYRRIHRRDPDFNYPAQCLREACMKSFDEWQAAEKRAGDSQLAVMYLPMPKSYLTYLQTFARRERHAYLELKAMPMLREKAVPNPEAKDYVASDVESFSITPRWKDWQKLRPEQLHEFKIYLLSQPRVRMLGVQPGWDRDLIAAALRTNPRFAEFWVHFDERIKAEQEKERLNPGKGFLGPRGELLYWRAGYQFEHDQLLLRLPQEKFGEHLLDDWRAKAVAETTKTQEAIKARIGRFIESPAWDVTAALTHGSVNPRPALRTTWALTQTTAAVVTDVTTGF